MFEEFFKMADEYADWMDEVPYPCAILFVAPITALGGIATVIIGIAITTKRRIDKFVDKVLNKDEGE